MSTVIPARATTWRIDAAHTEVGFAVRHLMISTVKGRFSGVQGTVTTRGDDFSGATVEATIDAGSIDTREPQRDGHLRSPDFFHVDQFPSLTYISRRVESHGHGKYSLVGDLTIRGVTREVVLDVTAEGLGRDPWGNERAGFSARGVINRRDFGLTYNQVLETGGVIIGEDVKLSIDLELIKEAASKAA
jgi:polyisoprenoid-binding protein YceI